MALGQGLCCFLMGVMTTTKTTVAMRMNFSWHFGGETKCKKWGHLRVSQKRSIDEDGEHSPFFGIKYYFYILLEKPLSLTCRTKEIVECMKVATGAIRSGFFTGKTFRRCISFALQLFEFVSSTNIPKQSCLLQWNFKKWSPVHPIPDWSPVERSGQVALFVAWVLENFLWQSRSEFRILHGASGKQKEPLESRLAN